MKMQEQEQKRFAMLRLGPSVPFKYVRDYYGLDWPPSDDLKRDYEK